MKKIAPLFLIFFAFCYSCEKNNDGLATLSGTLTPIADQSDIELGEISIYLGKYAESLAFDEITIDTDDIVLLDSTMLAADGSFEFTGLSNGNYSLLLEPNYIFSFDTIQILNIEDKDVSIDKTMELAIEDNYIIIFTDISSVKKYNKYWKFDILNTLNSSIRLDSAYFWDGNILVSSLDLGNAREFREIEKGIPDDGDVGIEFVFFDEDSQQSFHSQIINKSEVGSKLPISVNHVRIDYHWKWTWMSKTFFISN